MHIHTYIHKYAHADIIITYKHEITSRLRAPGKVFEAHAPCSVREHLLWLPARVRCTLFFHPEPQCAVPSTQSDECRFERFECAQACNCKGVHAHLVCASHTQRKAPQCASGIGHIACFDRFREFLGMYEPPNSSTQASK